MKKTKVKKSIDMSNYVNKETGEEFYSEHSNNISITEETNLVIINSTEYVIIDSKARKYVEENFSPSETGRIFNMCDMVKGEYNILFDKKLKQYHTKNTLMTELDYTRNIFANFMKKLYNKSIIYYIDGIKDKKKCIWIMLNPTLARKRKTINKQVVEVFTNLADIKPDIKKEASDFYEKDPDLKEIKSTKSKKIKKERIDEEKSSDELILPF